MKTSNLAEEELLRLCIPRKPDQIQAVASLWKILAFRLETYPEKLWSPSPSPRWLKSSSGPVPPATPCPTTARAHEQRRCSSPQNQPAGSAGSQPEGGRRCGGQITWEKGSRPEELPAHRRASYKPVLNKQNPRERFRLRHLLHR